MSNLQDGSPTSSVVTEKGGYFVKFNNITIYYEEIAK